MSRRPFAKPGATMHSSDDGLAEWSIDKPVISTVYALVPLVPLLPLSPPGDRGKAGLPGKQA